MNIKNDLYSFCDTKNIGMAGLSGISPRANWIIKWLQDKGIDHRLDLWSENDRHYHNIEIPLIQGFENGIILLAHHDIVRPELDNINDNSASIINLLYLSIVLQELPINSINKNVTIVFTDCEERGGRGSQRLSDRINSNVFGKIDWALNLELTCKGQHWLLGDPGRDSKLVRTILTAIPNCEIAYTPYNDAMTLRSNGIDSVVVGILPLNDWDRLDYSIFGYCHTSRDVKGLENTDDMLEFINGLIKIIQIKENKIIKKIPTNQKRRQYGNY